MRHAAEPPIPSLPVGAWECSARFVPGDLDLDIQTRLSVGPNVFHVNLAQIRPVVPKIFHSQTN